jgi:hypothetical protein
MRHLGRDRTVERRPLTCIAARPHIESWDRSRFRPSREEEAMPTTRASATPSTRQQPTLEEIRALVGGEDTTLHTAILATGATYAEIEQALMEATGAGEALGKTSHPLEGAAARVFELLAAEEAEED